LKDAETIHEDLVIRARRDDSYARASLYKEYSRAMYNICTRMTGNKQDAEDILHDAFIYAFEHIHQIREPAAFGGWLRKIVIGKCIQLSKTQFKTVDFDESYLEGAAEEQAEWWTGIAPEQIHEEIKALPNGCRQVFVLYVFENFSHKMIADNLGVSESTSKSQYQRARQLLRERITKRISING
jgi:RNA polymerase sigma factor (sigma-70 family)